MLALWFPDRGGVDECFAEIRVWVAGLVIATQAAAQVTFYEGEDFRGRSFTTDRQVGNFAGIGFNDRASSVVVRRDRWEVCEDAQFGGRCVVLQAREAIRHCRRWGSMTAFPRSGRWVDHAHSRRHPVCTGARSRLFLLSPRQRASCTRPMSRRFMPSSARRNSVAGSSANRWCRSAATPAFPARSRAP